MIKKQNIWALTLFSLILVLSVYYITLPDEIDVSSVATNIKTTISNEKSSEVIMTLKADSKEKIDKKTKELQEILTKDDSTTDEKNNAYEELKLLNLIKTKEEEISMKISDKYKLENFVEIDGDKIKVVIVKKDHTSSLASEIMDFIQEEFDEKKYISVTFSDGDSKKEQ